MAGFPSGGISISGVSKMPVGTFCRGGLPIFVQNVELIEKANLPLDRSQEGVQQIIFGSGRFLRQPSGHGVDRFHTCR